jgi:hypothetical protein
MLKTPIPKKRDNLRSLGCAKAHTLAAHIDTLIRLVSLVVNVLVCIGKDRRREVDSVIDDMQMIQFE